MRDHCDDFWNSSTRQGYEQSCGDIAQTLGIDLTECVRTIMRSKDALIEDLEDLALFDLYTWLADELGARSAPRKRTRRRK